MSELYNNHNWMKIFGVFLIFIAFLFLIVLFTYISGNPSFMSLGSELEPYGQVGEIIGTIIIVLLFVIGTFILIYYFTTTNICKKLVQAGDVKAVKLINPSKDQLMQGQMQVLYQEKMPGQTVPQGQINKFQINTIEQEEMEKKIVEEKRKRLDEYYKEELRRIAAEEDRIIQKEKEKLESNNELLEKVIEIKKYEDAKIQDALNQTKDKLNVK